MGVPLGERVNVGAFSAGQRRYLEFHQEPGGESARPIALREPSGRVSYRVLE
jgi:hypothetical protein